MKTLIGRLWWPALANTHEDLDASRRKKIAEMRELLAEIAVAPPTNCCFKQAEQRSTKEAANQACFA